MKTLVLAVLPVFLLACETNLAHKQLSETDNALVNTTADSAAINPVAMRETREPVNSPIVKTGIVTGSVTREELIRFAETLVGTPYVYGSTDPKIGFDCSGFITYVFRHFQVEVPRSSVDFTDVGQTVSVSEARRGDIILFTGTGAFDTDVGHMGLVVSNDQDGLHFIHSTSGKAMGVTITPLNEQYRKRFVKISRMFM